MCDGVDSNHVILVPYCLNCYYTHIKCTTTSHTHIICTADYTYYLNTYHTHCVQYCVFESPPSHTVHDTALLLPQLQCTMYVHFTCTYMQFYCLNCYYTHTSTTAHTHTCILYVPLTTYLNTEIYTLQVPLTVCRRGSPLVLRLQENM